MASKGKLAAAVILAVSAFPPAASAEDSCSTMARINATDVARALKAMSTDVFGKPSDLWTAEDFDNLVRNAEACDGLPRGVKFTVSAKHWRERLAEARDGVLRLSAVSHAIRSAYAPRWSYGDLPACSAVLSWQRERLWMTDNSAEIFGVSLSDMDAEGRVLAAGYVNECVPVMEGILEANRLKPEPARQIADDVAASAAREQAAAEEDVEELAPTLRVEHKGKRVPLAYISADSRRMVLVASKVELSGIKLSTDQAIMLSRWAEKIELSGIGGPERLYSGAVRKVVAKHVFRQP